MHGEQERIFQSMDPKKPPDLDIFKEAMRDQRVSIFPHGGDILPKDILEKAKEDIDGVLHLAALWILQCHEHPETAFEVNVRGTLNVAMAARWSTVARNWLIKH